jgi:hypothetical protein
MCLRNSETLFLSSEMPQSVKQCRGFDSSFVIASRPEREALHLPIFNAESKNVLNFTANHAIIFHGMVLKHRNSFTPTFL